MALIGITIPVPMTYFSRAPNVVALDAVMPTSRLHDENTTWGAPSIHGDLLPEGTCGLRRTSSDERLNPAPPAASDCAEGTEQAGKGRASGGAEGTEQAGEGQQSG